MWGVVFFIEREVVVCVVRWVMGCCGYVLVWAQVCHRALPGSYLVHPTQGVTS